MHRSGSVFNWKIGLLLCFQGFLHRSGFSFYLKIGLILYCQRFYLRLESISNVFYLSKELEILIPPLPTIVLRSGIWFIKVCVLIAYFLKHFEWLFVLSKCYGRLYGSPYVYLEIWVFLFASSFLKLISEQLFNACEFF